MVSAVVSSGAGVAARTTSGGTARRLSPVSEAPLPTSFSSAACRGVRGPVGSRGPAPRPPAASGAEGVTASRMALATGRRAAPSRPSSSPSGTASPITRAPDTVSAYGGTAVASRPVGVAPTLSRCRSTASRSARARGRRPHEAAITSR